MWQISAPWIGSLNRLRRTHDKAYKRALRTNMFDDWENFRKIRNWTNTQLTLAKANYIANLARSVKNEALIISIRLMNLTTIFYLFPINKWKGLPFQVNHLYCYLRMKLEIRLQILLGI